MTNLRAAAVALPVAAVLLATVAGCTSSSDGTGTPPARATITTTATATSAAPPTGSGVPASGSATASATGSSSGPGLCTPTVMTFEAGQGSGAAGSVYFPVHATNASQSPCVTTGFPGVAFVDGAGNQYVQATRDESTPATTITVAPGEQVTATVRVGTAGSMCTQSSGFLFTLPDNTDSTKLTLYSPVCDATVGALVKGAGS